MHPMLGDPVTGQGAQSHPFRHALDQPPWRCRDCDAPSADAVHNVAAETIAQRVAGAQQWIADAYAVRDPWVCPVHGISDCSPLLNGCDLALRHAVEKSPEVREIVPHDPDETPEQQRQRIRDGVWMWGSREGATHWAEFDKAGNNVTEDTDPELTGNPDGVGVLAQEADLPDWMVAGQTVATEQPLAMFIMARLDHLAMATRPADTRASRMVKALRAITRDHLAVHEIVGDTDPCTCHLLRQLASVWADHDAYLPEWRLR